jgi:DNA-binding NtrC family response regulator
MSDAPRDNTPGSTELPASNSAELRILVVDDDYNMAKTLSDILKITGYRVEMAQSGTEALDKVKEIPFDCVLSDIRMPGIDGIELYRGIKARRPDLPVVLMTAYTSHHLVQEGLQEGVIAALTKPLDIGLLLRFFSFLRGERAVIIVDDDAAFCQTLRKLLQMRGFAARSITNPHQVMENLRDLKDVVLLDVDLGDVSGIDVLHEIRSRYAHLPVILVTGHRVEMIPEIQESIETDAYTCLYKPIEIANLIKILTQIQHQQLRNQLVR